MNQIIAFRIGVLGLGALALIFLVAGLCVRPAVESDGPTAEQELVDVLRRLRATTDDQARARIMRDGRREGRRALGPLTAILGDEQHELHAQAIDYASALGLSELRPAVAGWAHQGSAASRAAAVRAAERLGPWSSAELVQLLSAEESEQVQIAALEIAVRRPDAPWAEVLRLLSSEEPAVRTAAMAAMPRRPPPEAARALRELIAHGAPRDAAVGLSVLGRTELIAELEPEVVALLPDAEPDVQIAALECLAGKAGRLAKAAEVSALAWDSDAEPRVRAAALLCLERTGSHDAAEVRERIGALEPLLRYFAARCLVVSGDPEGSTVLLELVDEPSGVSSASRALLASLTRLSPGATADEFRERLEGQELPAGPLPPPAMKL